MQLMMHPKTQPNMCHSSVVSTRVWYSNVIPIVVGSRAIEINLTVQEEWRSICLSSPLSGKVDLCPSFHTSNPRVGRSPHSEDVGQICGSTGLCHPNYGFISPTSQRWSYFTSNSRFIVNEVSYSHLDISTLLPGIGLMRQLSIHRGIEGEVISNGHSCICTWGFNYTLSRYEIWSSPIAAI